MSDRDARVLPQSAEDERRLAEGLARGDAGAAGVFLDRSHRPVYGLACRLTRDPDLRRDWTHATLLGVIEDVRRGRFVWRRPGSFWAWFRTRAWYRLLDEWRRSRRDALREIGGDEGSGAIELAEFGAADPADEMERVELRNAVERCLEALTSDDHRRALALLLLDDLTYQDVAGATGAPLNTVRAWIRRGRIALRRCLAERWGLVLPR
jgi:RNA polymerase sigma-70 factor (ECF subfamily)